MTDRLSQIQDHLDEITEIFFTSVGVLQRDAPLMSTDPSNIPVTSWTKDQIEKNQQDLSKFSKEMSLKLIQKFKEMDTLIDQLPGIHKSKDEMMNEIKVLDENNMKVETKYKQALSESEILNCKLKLLLSELIDEQYQITSSSNS